MPAERQPALFGGPAALGRSEGHSFMLSGVNVVCFAASYGVALALEITRLLFRSGIRGAVMVGFAGAGLLAHSIYLFYRAVSTQGPPLSSQRDWCLLAAWVLAGVYLYLTVFHRRAAFGVFLLPLVLGLVGAGVWFADPEPFAREPASRFWGMIHGGSVLLAVVAILVGFATGLMYLFGAWRLKRKIPSGVGLRLPSLEWLQRANIRAIGSSVAMLGVGLVSGVILNLIRRPERLGRLPWDDPLVVFTLITFLWLLVSLLASAFYRPARQGGRVAYFTVVTFVLLIIALAVGFSMRTQHGGRREEPVVVGQSQRTGAEAWVLGTKATGTESPSNPRHPTSIIQHPISAASRLSPLAAHLSLLVSRRGAVP